jgi:hypothetical protein
MAKRLATIYGAVFALVGIMGFIPNPLVGDAGFFATNTPHDLTHLLIGLVLLWAGTRTEHAAYVSMLTFGAVYGLLAVLGYAGIGAEGHTMLLGFVHINGNDNWLHVLLAVALIVTALATRKNVRTVHAH